MHSFISLAILAASLTSTNAWTTYVVPHTDGADDTVALMQAFKTGQYSSNATILFEKGVHYNIFTPISFPKFANVEVAIEGNLTIPSDVATVQKIVADSSFPGHWFYFTGGTNVTLRGTTDPEWGWVDGHGQAWWDTMEQVNRPHGWAFRSINGGVIKDMKLWKPVAWSFSTSGSSNVHAYNNKILAVSNSKSFPFNTDGFSAAGTNLLFENNHIENGDDCVTVGNGANGIIFRNSYCWGGHGLSVGSLGKGGQVASVQNVLIENIHMVNSLYGARFKSWTGGNGVARNITWRNIYFDDVPFPIYVTQNYWDQGVGPRPNTTSTNNTRVEDFTFDNFVGVIRDSPYVEGTCITDPCWYYVPGATGKEIAILDLYPGTNSNIRVLDVSARTELNNPVRVMCDPNAVSGDVGFKCWNGLFLPSGTPTSSSTSPSAPASTTDASSTIVTSTVVSSTVSSSTPSATPCAKPKCPLDNTGAAGSLITNKSTLFTCAYSAGSCTWWQPSLELRNTEQKNCPKTVTCPTN